MIIRTLMGEDLGPNGGDGVFFDANVVPGRVLAFVVKAGVWQGIYRPNFHDSSRYSAEAMDVSSLAIDEEKTFADGRAYSGIAYSFVNGRCVAEFLFKDGWPSSSRSYDKNGLMSSSEDGNSCGWERAEFYASGALKSLKINGPDVGDWILSFDAEDNLRFFSIKDAGSDLFGLLQEQFQFFPWRSEQDLFRTRIARNFSSPDLSLSSDTIKNWFLTNSFSKLEKIFFPKGILLELSDELMRAAPALKIVEADRPSSEELGRLRALYPGCTVLAG